MGRENIPVFVGVKLDVNADLFKIVQAANAVRFVLGFVQSRQKQGR